MYTNYSNVWNRFFFFVEIREDWSVPRQTSHNFSPGKTTFRLKLVRCQLKGI